MSGALLAVCISGGVAVLSALLFTIEARRGHRFGERTRRALDRAILVSKRMLTARLAAARPVLRRTFHYLAHYALSAILVVVRIFERLIARVVQFHRERFFTGRARHTTEAPPQKTGAHLSLLGEHRSSIELGEKEREERKRRALRGDS